MLYFTLLSLLAAVRLVVGHASPWHPSMFGYNVTAQTFDYDNRPVVPLANLPFSKWWFHNHLSYPPHPDDIFDLPVGQDITLEIACNKGATTFFASSEGGNTQEPNNPNNVCPGSDMKEYHTTGLDDVKGCALGIAYNDNVSNIKPADFTIFSVNHTCVWDRYTNFGVPDKMPPCPSGKCHCAFFWIHSPDSGSEQMYMNGFQCRTTGSTSNVGLATPPKVARRCGADPANGKPNAVPGNCTWGPKQPLYWFQAEQNNMFEGTYSPPFYNDLYNFQDGPQDDIFQDYYSSIPVPGPNQTELPVKAAGGSSPAVADNVVTTSASSIPTSAADATSSIPTSAADATSSIPTPAADATSSIPTSASSATSSSVTPSSSPNSKCSRKRNVSRHHAHAVQRSTSMTHKMAGMARRTRPLNLEKRSDVWQPL